MVDFTAQSVDEKIEDFSAKSYDINTLDSGTWEANSNTVKAAQKASF